MQSFRNFLAAVLLAAVVLGSVSAAFAQGFQVRPMVMELSAPPGRIAETTITLTNTSANPLSLTLTTVELSQDAVGSWQLLGAEAAAGNPNINSLAPWVALERGLVDLSPGETSDIRIQFHIPVDARGTYVASILAEQPPPQGAEGLVVRIRFLIPVLIEIAGRPVRQQVVLEDVGMQRIDASVNATASTTLSMGIANLGRTYSEVRGQVTLMRQSGTEWRTITRADIPKRGIIPGAEFDISADIGRRLPSGTYRLRGELFVDGRRVAPIETDIEFDGDRTISELAYDTALMLEPTVVSMNVVPGATRTTILTVENPGQDPVNVSIGSGTPKALAGMVMGDLVGNVLSAEPWTEIRPSEFTIRPGHRQNVRVISQIPKDGAQYPNYYADLVLQGTYQDGQSAGETRSMVHLANTREKSAYAAIVEQFAVSETDRVGQFTTQVRLVNTGTTHIEPAATLDLLTTGGQLLGTSSLSGEPGILLPLGNRTYGSELSLVGVEPGTYILRARFPLSPGVSVTDQHVLLIEPGEPMEINGEVVNKPAVTLDPKGSGIQINVGELEATPEEVTAPTRSGG